MRQKIQKDENKNKKKALLVFGIAATVAIAGTYALFQTSDIFNNKFNVEKYSPEVSENFVSPDNWYPGMTVPKTVKVTNKGSIPIVVRVSYEEYWKISRK